jgi:hypothetical protein
MTAPSTSVASLLAEIRARRADVAALKLTIRQTRIALAAAAAALEALEADCRRRGVAIVEASSTPQPERRRG